MDTQADRNYRESSVYTVARESNPTLVEFSYEYIMCVKHFEISSMLLRHTIITITFKHLFNYCLWIILNDQHVTSWLRVT